MHPSNSSINAFIAHARSKGMDHQTIRMLLLSSGWKEKDIAAALTSESLEMAVPLPPDSGSARDAFFHLLAFTSLYSTVIALIVLFFQYLNRLLPDAVTQGTQYLYNNTADLSGTRWSLAVVFIAFPLLLWMSKILSIDMRNHPEKAVSGVRRWLTYLTLFVTACTVMGDLITLIFFLLQGDLTTRFLLKVFVILVLCGVPFVYYFLSLRGSKWRQTQLDRLAFMVATAITAIAIVWGLWIVGSPMYGRQQMADRQRVSDLQAIQNEVLNITWGGKRYPPAPVTVPATTTSFPHPLPRTLDEIVKNATYQRLNTMDPVTQAPYEYRIVTPTTYELCATFDLELKSQYNIFWDHLAGHYCYEFNALDTQGK